MKSVLKDFHPAALWAGLTAFVWYVFGAVPLHISVSEQLGLATAQTASWIFIVWTSGAIASIAASLRYRQPIPITWTIPGLVYLGTLGDRFSLAELAGANLVAGALLLVLGLAGIGGRIMRWLAMGLGNVQGLGYLLAQGYQVPTNAVTTVVGATSVINAFFGGHAATVARTGVAILASPEAGPPSGRYWAAVIAAALTVAIALAATPLASLLNVLPGSYIAALAGVAILSSFQDALEKSFAGNMRFGAVAGFVVAATPFTLFGITSAFWAILAGLAASLCVERKELLDFWAGKS